MDSGCQRVILLIWMAHLLRLGPKQIKQIGSIEHQNRSATDLTNMILITRLT